MAFAGTLVALLLTATGTGFSLINAERKFQLNNEQDLGPQGVSLIINEYLADPPAAFPAGDANGDGRRDSSEDEFVELVNTGAAPLDISGFTLSDAAAVRFTFPSTPARTVVPAGEAVIVFGGGTPTGAFGNCTANHLVFKTGSAGLSLNNGGDTITVKDASANIVATLTYGSAEGGAHQSITRSPDVNGAFVTHSTAAGAAGRLFSPGTRTNGRPFVTSDPTITSISPEAAVAGGGSVLLTASGTNFQIASQIRVDGAPLVTSFGGATQVTATLTSPITAFPGSHSITVQNPDGLISNAVTFTVLTTIGINEYLADPPDGIAGDANGDGVRDSSQDEFVEVINRSGSPASIGGFTISDADQVRFTFPAGTVLPAGEVAVVFGGGSPRGEFGNASVNHLVFTASLSLNNGGDTITLENAGGAIVESIAYGASEGGANESINRNPDKLGAGFTRHSTIAGSGGRLFSPGTQVNGLPFTIGPRITHITPDRTLESNSAFGLSIEGAGFEPASLVTIDATIITSSFVNPALIIGAVPLVIASSPGPHLVEIRNASGNRSNQATLTIVPLPPALEKISPAFIEVGSRDFGMNFLGHGFDHGAQVLVDESLVATQFRSSALLTATIPASFARNTGTRHVRVLNGDGQQSNELSFEVIPEVPVINSILPQQVFAGAPAFTLTVKGAKFRPGGVILFGNAELPATEIAESQIQGQVPAALIAAPGERSISVRNPGGITSNELIFTIVAVPPVIGAVEPGNISAGAGDVVISIAGERFQQGAAVLVSDSRSTLSALETSFISSERLRANLPATLTAEAKLLFITVHNPDTGVSIPFPLNISINDSLVINEFLADPPDGLAGDANGDGQRDSADDEFIELVNRTNAPIDVSGFKLSDADAIRHIFAAGTIIPPFEALVVFGGGKPTGSFGNAAENGLVFVASSGGLSLNNGGDTIRLEDASAHLIQEIRYGSTEGGANQSINRDPDMDGAAFVPHGNMKSAAGRLFSPGARVSGETFTIQPRVQSLSPAAVRAGSGAFELSVRGERFLPGSVIFFGSTQLDTAYVSDSELRATVSAALVSEGGASNVRVKNPRGEISREAHFLITADPPVISSLDPPKIGTGAADVEISIKGERFQRGAMIQLATEAIPARFVASDLLTVSLPDKFFGAATTLTISVVNADGNRSNQMTLAVENGPLITRLPRSKIKAGRGDVELMVGGVAFESGATLYVDGVAVTTRFVDDATIVAVIPAALTAAPSKLSLQVRNSDGGRSNTVILKIV